jgi:hypothetical protein
MVGHNASYECIAECLCERERRVGVFKVNVPAEGFHWVIARIPSTWDSARSTRTAPCCADGTVETPLSILAPFTSETAALVIFHKCVA